MRLFLDDKRPVPDLRWTLASTARQAIDILKTQAVDELSLDHDLGHCVACTECNGYKTPCGCECHWTGMTVVIFMINTGRWPKNKPTVHSANPVGAENMRRAIDRYFDTATSALEPIPEEGGDTGFRLTFKEQVECDSFRALHWGRHKGTDLRKATSFQYAFIPTSIGTRVDITCQACKESKDVSEYESW